MFSILPPRRRHKSPHLVSIQEALEEIRAGRMIILMDDEDRENEATCAWRPSWSRPSTSISW